MNEVERRSLKRLSIRVPMRVVRGGVAGASKERVVYSLNISSRGIYFESEERFRVREKVRVWLKMPEGIVAWKRTEWCFIGRITRVSKPAINGKYGIGVYFLYYAEGMPDDLPFVLLGS